MQTISVKSYQEIVSIKIDRYPDICPHCHQGVVPVCLDGFKGDREVFLSFYCTRKVCGEYFVASYSYAHQNAAWRYSAVLLGYPILKEFSDIISEVSPLFESIYHQAEKAQSSGLNEICGMGYRKALEFLIKDYIITKGIADQTLVEQKLLGACIDDHINNVRIKDIAKRAAWLGNDESHYVRKWVELDVESLKQLINLTVLWIEMETTSDKLIEAMPVPEKKPKTK